MTELKTRPELSAALRRASTRELPPDTLHQQRVSFAMSALSKDSSITRAEVEKQVAKQDGAK